MAVGFFVGQDVGEGRIGGQLHVPCRLAVVKQFPTQVGGSGGQTFDTQIAHREAVERTNRHFHIVNDATQIAFAPFEGQTVRRLGHIEQVGGVLRPFTESRPEVCNGRKGVAVALVLGSEVAQLKSAITAFQPKTDLQFIEGIAELRQNGVGIISGSTSERQGLCAAVDPRRPRGCIVRADTACRVRLPAGRKAA